MCSSGDIVNLNSKHFETNLTVGFCQLKEANDYKDVTLSVGPGLHITAHRLVLAACSPLFHDIMQQNPHPHPLIYLKGIGLSDLKLVIHFMYYGEVKVEVKCLNSFLEVANELKVKGIEKNISQLAFPLEKVLSTSSCDTNPPAYQLTDKYQPASSNSLMSTLLHMDEHSEELSSISLLSEQDEQISQGENLPRNNLHGLDFSDSQNILSNDSDIHYENDAQIWQTQDLLSGDTYSWPISESNNLLASNRNTDDSITSSTIFGPTQ